jgi:hypothetical protein
MTPLICSHSACTGYTVHGARIVAPIESQRCQADVLYGDERCVMTREDRDSLCSHHRKEHSKQTES